jgi:hypothetical protein
LADGYRRGLQTGRRDAAWVALINLCPTIIAKNYKKIVAQYYLVKDAFELHRPLGRC